MKEYIIKYEDKYGQYFFTCQADDTEHAIDQCRDAFYDIAIVAVYYEEILQIPSWRLRNE